MDNEPKDINRIDGNVFGPAVQAGSIQGDVHFHLNPVPTASEPLPSPEPPSDWTALPDLPAEIRSLMHAQAQAAQQLPYRLPGARRPSLATVYVRQDLGNPTEDQQPEQPQPTPILDDHGRIVELSQVPVVRLAVRPPARRVSAALDGDRHLVVTGGPGLGKSTLSLRLAGDIATRWVAPSRDDAPLAEVVLPLRLTARELATRLGLPFGEALADCVRAEYGALLKVPVNAAVLGDRVIGCPWLLLVDGLDEVADSAERDSLVAVLSAWASNGSAYRIVLTTRPIDGAALAPLQRIGAARYELQPFDGEALKRFAKNWFADVGPDNAERFLREIRQAHLDELVKVPLLATIAAIIFEQHEDRPLPDNQYELYESYLSFLGSGRRCVPGPFDQWRTPLLEHLGRTRLETDTSLVAAARDWATQNIPATELTSGWQDQLTTFLSLTGPLVIRADDLTFLHHSFAEHLAATAAARELPERFHPEHDDFANRLHAAGPREAGRFARAVLLHYARLRPAEGDRVVRWLHAGGAAQHLLAARLLARHVPASAEAVDAFLGKVHGWAMTTAYAGEEILHQTGRATHHSGLTEWLLDLLRDTGAPWRSRVEAATALATRLRGPHGAEALALLRSIVDDQSIPVDERLAAAEALSDSGSTERVAAERGLRSVLGDPLASGANCRTAAVVLSTFGAQARTDAVEALSQLVSGPDTPTEDLVQAANGLIEIDFEFHERCADVFRAVLSGAVDSIAGRRDAALGLASLGPQYLAEAVSRLTTWANDSGFDRIDRASAARILGELGPQHRVAAGYILSSILIEPRTQPVERLLVAIRLVDLGSEFKDLAVSQLRSMSTDRQLSRNNARSAAVQLASVGPEFQTEAADMLWSQYTDPMSGEEDRVHALDDLARLSGDHRGTAMEHLRSLLADGAANPMVRCQAASSLINATPELHAEAGRHLRHLADSQLNPMVSIEAWQQLLTLDTAFQDLAPTALLDLARSDQNDEPSETVRALRWSSADHIEQAAKILLAVADDETRSDRARVSAISGLVSLGRPYHRPATARTLSMMLNSPDADMQLSFAVRPFTSSGTGIRAKLGDALREIVLDPRSPSVRKWRAVEAMGVLGIPPGPEAAAALHAISGDESAELYVRWDASIALVRMAPEYLAEITELVLKTYEQHVPHWWKDPLLELTQLGADVVPALRAILTDNDTTIGTRGAVTSLLVTLGSSSEGLRGLDEDEFLEFSERSRAWQSLDKLDRDSFPAAVAYHLGVFDDQDDKMDNRMSAAQRLVQLDPTYMQRVTSFLHTVVKDSYTPAKERRTGVEILDELAQDATDTVNPLILAALHDPWGSPYGLRWLANRLPGTMRTDVERTLLADRSVPIQHRLPRHDYWGRPLAAETEAEVRDTLAAVESRPADRVAAAKALADLSWRLIPEAVRLLEEFDRQGCAPDDARRALATLGPRPRSEVRHRAEDRVRDEALPRRERYQAAMLVMDLTVDPPSFVVDFVRQVARDGPDVDQVDALVALGRLDGLDGLRAVRDDVRRSPFVRRRAAVSLLDRMRADRAAGLRVLHGIAADVAVRPALRWRVARDLARFGVPGRDRAAEVLREMVADRTLPVTARAQAARVVNDVAPSSRPEVLGQLRGMLPTRSSLHLVQVYSVIGALDGPTADDGLRAMVRDTGIGAVARLRCAEALVELRRDRREAAAVVARAIAWDESVAGHVRRRAAVDLARWSELCRGEARGLIRALTPGGPASGG